MMPWFFLRAMRFLWIEASICVICGCISTSSIDELVAEVDQYGNLYIECLLTNSSERLQKITYETSSVLRGLNIRLYDESSRKQLMIMCEGSNSIWSITPREILIEPGKKHKYSSGFKIKEYNPETMRRLIIYVDSPLNPKEVHCAHVKRLIADRDLPVKGYFLYESEL